MIQHVPFLLHYSRNSIENIKKKKQKSSWKPVGLWYSLGTAWKDWGDAESFEISDNFVYKLTVDYSKILHVSSEEEIDQFSKIYGVPDPSFHMDAIHGEKYFLIDWKRVAEQYHGIEISPYLWSRRFTHMWYYGWDVPSGCIWNPGAIQEFRLFNNG